MSYLLPIYFIPVLPGMNYCHHLIDMQLLVNQSNKRLFHCMLYSLYEELGH